MRARPMHAPSTLTRPVLVRPRIARAIALALACGASVACRNDPPAPDAPVETTSEAAVATWRKNDPLDDECLVDFIDLGSGLAVFIRCKPAGGSVLRILYDGGSVEPKLNKQGRLFHILEKGLGLAKGSTIDHLFQSHPHYDHHSDLIRGNGILKNYKVKHVWDPAAYARPKSKGTVAYACFMDAVVVAANNDNLVYHPARRCPDLNELKQCDGKNVTRWTKDSEMNRIKPFQAPARDLPMQGPEPIPFGVTGISGKFLHADPTVNAHGDANDASIVISLDLFGVKVLLTGDEEAGRKAASTVPAKADSVEQFLVTRVPLELRAHIVQVAHHGSNTSSTKPFEDRVIVQWNGRGDTYAVISSGKKLFSGVELPIAEIEQSWRDKLGTGHLVSTKRNDDPLPGEAACSKNPNKIAPDPANDESPAGCNNIQFVINNRLAGRKIASATYWPIGGRIP